MILSRSRFIAATHMKRINSWARTATVATQSTSYTSATRGSLFGSHFSQVVLLLAMPHAIGAVLVASQMGTSGSHACFLFQTGPGLQL
jgi:hypothetical protein